MMYPTRGLCIKDKICYVDEKWIKVFFSPLDCVSIVKDKFKHGVTTRDLLIETLITSKMMTNRGIIG